MSGITLVLSLVALTGGSHWWLSLVALTGGVIQPGPADLIAALADPQYLGVLWPLSAHPMQFQNVSPLLLNAV